MQEIMTITFLGVVLFSVLPYTMTYYIHSEKNDLKMIVVLLVNVFDCLLFESLLSFTINVN